jgi:hypothetical protein
MRYKACSAAAPDYSACISLFEPNSSLPLPGPPCTHQGTRYMLKTTEQRNLTVPPQGSVVEHLRRDAARTAQLTIDAKLTGRPSSEEASTPTLRNRMHVGHVSYPCLILLYESSRTILDERIPKLDRVNDRTLDIASSLISGMHSSDSSLGPYDLIRCRSRF